MLIFATLNNFCRCNLIFFVILHNFLIFLLKTKAKKLCKMPKTCVFRKPFKLLIVRAYNMTSFCLFGVPLDFLLLKNNLLVTVYEEFCTQASAIFNLKCISYYALSIGHAPVLSRLWGNDK